MWRKQIERAEKFLEALIAAVEIGKHQVPRPLMGHPPTFAGLNSIPNTQSCPARAFPLRQAFRFQSDRPSIASQPLRREHENRSMDLPLFHLYGDPPDPRAFNFVHAETIPARSSRFDWQIGIHRHCNLSQILVIERGGGEVQYEAST